MCRMVAWQGQPRPLSHLISAAHQGLQAQAFCSKKAKVDQHADGTGVVWYTDQKRREKHCSTLPAWDDPELNRIAQSESSHLFLAHARAATTGSVCDSNCHPFVGDGWSFMHNGQIAQFDGLRESLFELLPITRRLSSGATDSEFLFALALENGLEADVSAAWSQTLELVREAVCKSNASCLIRCSAIFTNGEKTYALRYSCDEKPPSLFVQSHEGAGTAIASEPVLNEFLPIPWRSLPPNSLTTISSNDHETELLDM